MPATRLGSELFLNRGDSPEQIRAWVEQMHASGLHLIRLFNFWDLCNPREDVWDWSAFDAVFDTAARLGMGVVPTPFAQTPPGWMRKVDNIQGVGDFEDPAFRRASHDYLRRLVERYRNHPALDSWIVWNEACLLLPVTPPTLAKFRSFLRQAYGDDIHALNAVTYEQFSSFEQVSLQANPSDGASPIAARVKQLDWHRFTVAYLMDLLRELRDIIRALDPVHPIHVNPHATASAVFMAGQNVWREGDLFDFMGSSAHPVWHSTRFPAERVTQSIGYFAALMRSATRAADRKFWVSELQGGPAIYSGERYGCPRPHELRAWLWESIGRGAEGIVFWTFSGRTHDGEAGEWMLLDQEGAPSRRLHEVRRVAERLREHQSLFRQAKPPRTRLRLLYSEASMMMGYVFGGGDDVQNPRNRFMASDALLGAFCLFDDLGYEVDFISEERLREDPQAGGAAWLVLPDCVALEPGTHQALQAFVDQGGSVLCDGLCGWKNPHSFVDRRNAPTLTQLFGAALQDIEPLEAEFCFAYGGEAVPGWFNEISLRPAGAEVLAGWDGERAAVTRLIRPQGGVALRIGTHLFQRYFARQDAAIRRFVARLLPQEFREDLHLENGGPLLRLRRLDLSDGVLGILINTAAEATTARVALREGLELVDLDGGALSSPLPIGPHEVRLLWGRPSGISP